MTDYEKTKDDIIWIFLIWEQGQRFSEFYERKILQGDKRNANAVHFGQWVLTSWHTQRQEESFLCKQFNLQDIWVKQRRSQSEVEEVMVPPEKTC